MDRRMFLRGIQSASVALLGYNLYKGGKNIWEMLTKDLEIQSGVKIDKALSEKDRHFRNAAKKILDFNESLSEWFKKFNNISHLPKAAQSKRVAEIEAFLLTLKGLEIEFEVVFSEYENLVAIALDKKNSRYKQGEKVIIGTMFQEKILKLRESVKQDIDLNRHKLLEVQKNLIVRS